VQRTKKWLGREENFGKNTKRERAKSSVVEKIKTVLVFEHKIVVVSSYGLTPCCSGRDNGGINFKHRAGNVPPLNNGVILMWLNNVESRYKIIDELSSGVCVHRSIDKRCAIIN